MNLFKIAITRQAQEDMTSIGDYIAYTLEEPETASKFIADLRAAVLSLHSFPYRYQLIDDPVLSSQGIHSLTIKNYYVFYQISDELNTVVVLRVGYNRRNWKEILTDDFTNQ